MIQSVLVVSLSAVALVLLLIVAKMWVGKEWFVQWLKGNLGIVMIVVSVLLVFSAIDAASYRQAHSGEVLYTVTTYQLEPQVYEVEMVSATNGHSARYEIQGEQWQLELQTLAWRGPGSSVSDLPAYRPASLEGRYLSLEQERTSHKQQVSLSESRWVNLWSIFRDANLWLDGDVWRLQFMPLVNGANYTILIGQNGLETSPLNDVATQALKGNW
ncbi:hypothetical protein [Parathalassolituus penaei]|uniref:Cation/multidrug efflux pump n=1 Tax=Parathalassolituus penaei TaxID=2997323 RepID=A0A9X3EEQ4_9GAMM|nr:hypothetical protein [Parathalassolituus penaei]MCY0965434.1 hypothetical protein [Parathalassolituus penaei]